MLDVQTPAQGSSCDITQPLSKRPSMAPLDPCRSVDRHRRDDRFLLEEHAEAIGVPKGGNAIFKDP